MTHSSSTDQVQKMRCRHALPADIVSGGGRLAAGPGCPGATGGAGGAGPGGGGAVECAKPAPGSPDAGVVEPGARACAAALQAAGALLAAGVAHVRLADAAAGACRAGA